jgi:CheY-like chemotaxis protein
MNILILDDSLARLTSFRRKLIGAVVTCVERSKDCIKELEENGPFDYLFLDHDLDQRTYVPSGPGTGYEVALWLKNNPEKKPNKIILHTCNEYGIVRMKEELPEAICLPGVFSLEFDLSKLDMIEIIYSKHVKMFA